MERHPEQLGSTPEYHERLRIQTIVIPADEARIASPGELNPTNLADYQRAVDGYIEHVALEQPAASMYVNEEGKLRGLPVNRRATLLLWMHNPAFRYGDVIVGDAVIAGPPDADGHDTNVSPELLQTLFEAKQFCTEVRVHGEADWHGNQRRFTEWAAAYAYVLDLGHRWTAVEDVRVVPEA